MRLLPNYETTLRQPLQEEAIGTESFYFLQRDSSRGQTVVIASDGMQTAGGPLQSCIISAVQGGRHRGEAMRSCAIESDSLVCPKIKPLALFSAWDGMARGFIGLRVRFSLAGNEPGKSLKSSAPLLRNTY